MPTPTTILPPRRALPRRLAWRGADVDVAAAGVGSGFRAQNWLAAWGKESHELRILARPLRIPGQPDAQPVDVIPGALSTNSQYLRGGTESWPVFGRRPTCAGFQNSEAARQPGPPSASKGAVIAPLT
jgi:hypothetical protein